MITINRTKDQWDLYSKATAKDATTLNAAANKAVMDTLYQMQFEGVTIEAALNTSLSMARAKFHQLADVGAFDTGPLEILDDVVTRQFLFRRD